MSFAKSERADLGLVNPDRGTYPEGTRFLVAFSFLLNSSEEHDVEILRWSGDKLTLKFNASSNSLVLQRILIAASDVFVLAVLSPDGHAAISVGISPHEKSSVPQ